MTSGSDVERSCSKSTALPNPPVVSSGSGLKRALAKGTASEDEEQPVTHALISTLIARLHSLDAAEDNEICNCGEVHDELFNPEPLPWLAQRLRPTLANPTLPTLIGRLWPNLL